MRNRMNHTHPKKDILDRIKDMSKPAKAIIYSLFGIACAFTLTLLVAMSALAVRQSFFPPELMRGNPNVGVMWDIESDEIQLWEIEGSQYYIAKKEDSPKRDCYAIVKLTETGEYELYSYITFASAEFELAGVTSKWLRFKSDANRKNYFVYFDNSFPWNRPFGPSGLCEAFWQQWNDPARVVKKIDVI